MKHRSAERGTNRSRLIEEYKPFVHAAASAHCHRALEWGRDEELSIALLALDAALDHYLPDKGAKFETFAALVIKRRLIDYQRKEQKYKKREITVAEIPPASSITGEDSYQHLERAAELEEFALLLEGYGISFRDLAGESPRQQAVRDRFFRAVRLIINQPGLATRILDRGRLPLQELALLTGETAKTLGKRRRYLLALLLVATRKGELPFISMYLKIGGNGNA